MDSRPDEGALETPDRGEGGLRGVRAEQESDQLGAPGGVLALELARATEPLLGGRGYGATTRAIVGGQSLAPTGQPADVADGAIGDLEVGRDLGQGVPLLVTAHDLLTERDREGAWHGNRLRSSKRDQLLTNADVTHAES
jgi:hypothetical protein